MKGIIEGIPSIGAEHLDNEGGFNLKNLRYIPQQFAEKMNRGVLKQKDILIVKDGATTGKTSLVTDNFPFNFACVNEHVFICRFFEILSSNFVFHYLRSQQGQEQIMSTFHGGAQGGINSEFADAVSIPLPPLGEQKRIVEKLDAILPKMKSAKSRLEKIPAILKKFRQSVLAAAFSGRLTEDWREGKDLPEWENVILKEIADIKGGVTKDTAKQKNTDIEVPYLRVANVQRGYLDLSDVKRIKIPQNKLSDYLLKKGDVLLNEGGDPDKLGRGWIWEGQIENCSHQNHVFRARLFDFKNQPKYISWYANTIGSDFFFQSGKQTTGLASVNKTMLSSLPILLPQAEEQHEIVRRVEKLFSLADSLEAKYKKAMERVEKIELAVLAKAFRGELVEPDPNDEPSKELLKRIMAEKVKMEGGKKLRKIRRST